MINKTDAVRAAIRKRPLTLDEIRAIVERRLKQIISRQKLYNLLSVMQCEGEVDSCGRGARRWYVLVKP